MAKSEKKKKSDVTTPENSLVKLTTDCSSSSVVSEQIGSQDPRHDAPVFSASIIVSQPSLDQEKLDESEIHELPVLTKIIVQRYEGDKCGEVFHGEGVAFFQGGHVYKGSFVRGLMHGRGEYTWADGLKYEGDFASNIPMGQGTYTWLDGSTYEGEVHCGIRHGVGTYKCAKSSTVYRGQWHQGKRHGKGTMYYNEEVTSWYEGDWQNNRREGWGIRCYPSGNIYEGQWKKNILHGEGRMRWIHLGQQYCGQWVDGVQHGHGTHTWILRRVPGSQYPLRNEYKGEYVQGTRHGKGTFFYASGAEYSGEWKQNKKHGKGKFIFKNGRIYEGEFLDDRMAEFPAFSVDGAKTPDLSGIRTHSPPHAGGDSTSRAKQSRRSTTVLGPDMVLNIQTLLNQIPESRRDHELRQVEFAIMRHTTLLRSIYSLYSSLGRDRSPDNTFLLTRLQFWRFLKDCGVHQHGITLAQIDRLTDAEDHSPKEVHSPFSTMLLRKYLSCIVTAAYHIYHKHIESSVSVLEECFSRLMKQNIIPNAKNIKGPLFCHPLHAAVGMNYINRCWEIYQTLCKGSADVFSDQIMIVRHFIWMFKDLELFDSELTTMRVLEILSVENPAIYTATHSNLDLEMTFLEFFETLLSCAEVKTTHGIQTVYHRQSELDYLGKTVRTSRGEMRDSSLLSQWNSPQNDSTAKCSGPIISSGSDLETVKTKSPRHSSPDEEVEQSLKNQESNSASKLSVSNTNGDEVETKKESTSCVSVIDTKMISNTEAVEDELEGWSHRIHRIHQFFTLTFFPAYEHNLMLRKEVQEEQLRRIANHKIALDKAKEKARLREQWEAEEEERRKEEEDEDERGDIPDEDLNHSSPALVTPVTSSTSVLMKQLPSSGNKKKKK